MSNEMMTDARALAEIDGYVPRHCRAAIEHIAARLRGDGAALSTQPAPSAPVVVTDELIAKILPGALLFAEEAEHLADARRRAKQHLEAALSAPSEQVAASVPCAFRSLLAEARRQYRDSDAAGDVLAWLDERVLDVDHAASVAVPEGGRDA